MDRDETGGISDQEWKNRVLCSDESCIGIIGPDGRCKECGLPYEGELPITFTDTAASDANDAQLEALSEKDTGDEGNEEESASTSDDAWDRRKLCVDESCIGVIGPDGRCKECGKPG